MIFPVFAVGVLVLFAALVFSGVRRARARQRAFQAYVTGRGWSYARRDDSKIRREGAPFGTGGSRHADNAVSGTINGKTFLTYDYQYTTGSGEDSTTHHVQVCLVALPRPVPRLQITPEGFWSRLGGGLGMQDIELESAAFNDRYRITSDEPRFAYDVLHPRTMSALLDRPPMSYRLDGHDAVTWANGRWDPRMIELRVAELCVLLDGIPGYVWSDR